MSALNVAAIWSPASSISFSRSSWEAVACPRSLTIASSAARWRVSSTRRAFSSATLRLVARVFSNRTSAFAERVRPVQVLKGNPAEGLPAVTSGANTSDFGRSPSTPIGDAGLSLPDVARHR